METLKTRCWQCDEIRTQIILEKHYVSDTCYLFKLQCSKCHTTNTTLANPTGIVEKNLLFNVKNVH